MMDAFVICFGVIQQMQKIRDLAGEFPNVVLDICLERMSHGNLTIEMDSISLREHIRLLWEASIGPMKSNA